MADIKSNLEENQSLVNHFIAISDGYLQAGDKRRFGTFKKVAGILADLDVVVTKEYEVTQHPGVGGSSEEIVHEFLESGTSSRLEEVNQLIHEAKAARKNTPVEELVGRMLEDRDPSLGSGQATSMLYMWTAINGCNTIQSMQDMIQSAPPGLVNAGLATVLYELSMSIEA